MERIGILGGTFDPPHLGHLILAECAVEALDLSRILFVPAGIPPHKLDKTKASIVNRLEMLLLALEGNRHFELSRVDVDRPGPHYSVDMVQLIQAQYPNAELFFVVGADSLRDLPNWHKPQALIELCRLAVVPRPDMQISPDLHDKLIPGLMNRVVIIDAPLIDISSSSIVERSTKHQSIRYFVPDAVRTYIETHQLYGAS
ncbi:MAG: nicotinate-nucleotide adenylyltransferase [Anaerolineae bacterium]